MSDGTRRVAMTLLWLRPGEVGGTETYARRLVRSATRHAADTSFALYGSATACEAVAPTGPKVGHHTVPVPKSRPQRVLVERRQLAEQIGQDVNVLHHPGGTVPFESDIPTVVTIHDLQPLAHPENFGRVKARFLAQALPEAVGRADIITTPSAWVADDVAERFDVPRDLVVPVSAFAEAVDLSAPIEPSARVAGLLDRGPVLFFPAMTMAHKNHRMLFEAFAEAHRAEPELQLVCVGAVGRDHEAIVAAARSNSAAIHVLGHVPRSDLRALYARSEALVFPSRYEGFGLPILEAQRSELPVIASDAAAIPEVAGDGATLLDPDDRDGWVASMLERPSGEDRAQRIAAGTANADRYSPESMAAQLTTAYKLAEH